MRTQCHELLYNLCSTVHGGAVQRPEWSIVLLVDGVAVAACKSRNFKVGDTVAALYGELGSLETTILP